MDINEVVEVAARVRADLGRLRQTSELVVMFVDLVGSTAYKAAHPNEEDWLPRLATFLVGVTRILESDGRVVKYIGDEVMATFEGAGGALLAEQAAERVLAFCEGLPDEDLKVKVALDFGHVSLLDFTVQRGDGASAEWTVGSRDPNGIVVDRCARIIAKGSAGAVLCSPNSHTKCNTPPQAAL